MDDVSQEDICRVCRCEGQSDRPLFYPCVCTGSIKYIHQDCLMQWMRYSHKEYCELCGHRFSFQPIYSPDMPRVLPLRDVIGGLLTAIVKAAKSWAHYSLVGIAWFIVVPLSAYRTYRYLFRASSFDMILSLPFDVFSPENLAADVFRGCFVVTCTLLSFIGLVWLREQILLGGGPDWLERDDAAGAVGAAANRPIAPANNNNINDGDGDRQEEVHAAPLEDHPPINRDVPDVNNEGIEAADEAIDEMAEDEEYIDVVNLDREDIGNGTAAAALAARLNIDIIHGNGPRIDFQNNNNVMPAAGPAIDNDDIFRDGGRRNVIDAGINDDNNNNNNAGAIAANAGPAVVDNDNDNDNDEPNWNPMEWDRAAEDLTWERLLGLDGSLVFLEHVFWIVSLNIMLIFAFAFCPYCIGHFILNALEIFKLDQPVLHFHGLITTLFGYCFIGHILVVLHFLAKLFHMRRVRNLIGLCYIVVKVSLLSVVEIGVLPLICGWWLDICSLPLFDATLKDRKASFMAAPGTFLFIHWMFGMVYVYYFAAFISLLREVLRPGVLWFLRNLNDPDFSPIQEMIHLPILKHVRRLISSTMIFGSIVLLMFWVPIRILKVFWPTFLPYTLSGDSEVNELSLQLLLLQVILPGFFEQSHTRVWLKKLLRVWCLCVAWILGMHSYLLGNDNNDPPTRTPRAANGNENNGGENHVNLNENVQENVQENGNGENNGDNLQEGQAARAVVAEGVRELNARAQMVAEGAPLLQRAPLENHRGGVPQQAQPQPQPPLPPLPPPRPAPVLNVERNLAAAHHAIIQRDVPLAFQSYKRPTFFALRLCGLIFFMCISLVMASLITLTIPIWIGRQVMSMWFVGGSISSQVVPATGGDVTNARPHELYTSALGTYLCWLITRGITIAATLLPQGRAAVMEKLRHWFRVGMSYALPILIIVLILGVVPLLFGLLLELVVIIPLRVGSRQTPIYFIWQDWALGVLYTKIAVALTFMGPDWRLKRALERAYRDGLRDIDLKFLIRELAMPVITCFGLALAVPYVLAYSIIPIFVHDPWNRLIVQHFMYPVFYFIIGLTVLTYFQIKQFKKLYVAIKVDKYLVGQRLVNYEHRKKQQQQQQQQEEQQNKVAAIAAASLIEHQGRPAVQNVQNVNNNEVPENNNEHQDYGPIENIIEQAAADLRERRHQQDDERRQLAQDLVGDNLL